MSQEQDFLKTITLLMRLTRNGKLQWQEKDMGKHPLTHNDALPTYEASFNDMKFRLEDASGPTVAHNLSRAMSGGYVAPGTRYQLVIVDLADSTKIESPPLKAANDLVAVIRSKGQRKIDDINRRLEEINKRLESAE